jgi:hypothetical protein
MIRSCAIVGIMTLATAGCLADRDPTAPYAAECLQLVVDTTGWQRVADTRAWSRLSSLQVSYLVPPAFERVGPFAWERHATRLQWSADEVLQVPNPYPEMVQTGNCRLQVSGHTVYLDYGTIGEQPDYRVIMAFWRSILIAGTRGDLLFSARMKDAADMLVIERIIRTIVISTIRTDD